MMLKLQPPLWAVIYILISAAISWWLGWPKVPGLPATPVGIALVVAALILPVSAIFLFRREHTEIDPTSPTNRTLVTT